jgi:hypothetical protein
MATIYLYIKRHNVTGLKYFGKTTRDPYKYKGSGKHWLRHLSVHGHDVTTEVVGQFDNQSDCTKQALEYSRLHNIVESPEWANLILEDGVRGGFNRKGVPLSDSHKANLSAARKGKNIKPHSEEHKSKIAKSLAGLNQGRSFPNRASRPHSEATKQKLRERALARWSPKYMPEDKSE